MAKRVMIVPGLMGTALSIAVPQGATRPVWLDYGYLAANGPGALELDAAGTGPGPLARGANIITRGDVRFNDDVARLIDRLLRDEWQPVFWGYDWRLDLVTLSQRLNAALAATFGNDDFYVIAYSMGGLITRLAYPLYRAATGGAANWKRTVYVAVPQYGSHQAAQYLSDPIQILPLVGQLMPLLASPIWDGTFFSPNRRWFDPMKRTVASWPSMYQLYPDITGVWKQQDPLGFTLYDLVDYPKRTNPYLSQVHMDRAKVVRDLVNATLTVPRAAERTVLGNSLPTPAAVRSVLEVDKPSGYRMGDGDGSVTEERTILPGVTPSLSMGGVLHNRMLGTPFLLAAIDALLTAETFEPQAPTLAAALPGPVAPPTQLLTIPERFVGNQPIRNDP